MAANTGVHYEANNYPTSGGHIAYISYNVYECRRGLVEFTAGLGLALSAAPPALAKVPKGFQAVRDTGDGYEFLFPFGWQEVSVSGIDTVYKDVIEPLESVSVQLTPTDKASITEYGPVNEVAGTLAGSVLARSTDEVQLIKSTQEEADGRHAAPRPAPPLQHPCTLRFVVNSQHSQCVTQVPG